MYTSVKDRHHKQHHLQFRTQYVFEKLAFKKSEVFIIQYEMENIISIYTYN